MKNRTIKYRVSNKRQRKKQNKPQTRAVGVRSEHSRLEADKETRTMTTTTGRGMGPFGQRVFVYMPTRGINLYPVKPPAASIQRLLVSLFGYLANENYDLTSTRFYCTGTLVSSPRVSLLPHTPPPPPAPSSLHFLSPTPLRLPGRQDQSRTVPSARLFFPPRCYSSQ